MADMGQELVFGPVGRFRHCFGLFQGMHILAGIVLSSERAARKGGAGFAGMAFPPGGLPAQVAHLADDRANLAVRAEFRPIAIFMGRFSA